MTRATALLAFMALSGVLLQQPAFEPFHRDLFAAATLVNAAADFDRDGDIDLFVGFNGSANHFFINEGRLRDVAVAAGIGDARSTRAAAWGDYDADGDPDLLVGYAPGLGSVVTLYRNDLGHFIDVTIPAGVGVENGAVRQTAWIDFDGDGDLDLFIAFRDRADALFRNEQGRFTDVAPAVGLADARKTVGAVWFDYDEDGDLDLYAAHMDGDANGLYRNDAGQFTDVAEAAGLAWGWPCAEGGQRRHRASVCRRRRWRRPLRPVHRQLRTERIVPESRQREVRGRVNGLGRGDRRPLRHLRLRRLR